MRGQFEATDADQSGVKICKGCSRALPFELYGVSQGRLRHQCNECRCKQERQRRLRNPEYVRALTRANRIKNIDRIRLRERASYWKNPERAREIAKSSKERHKEKRAEYGRRYPALNRDSERNRAKKWYDEHKERGRDNARNWRVRNPDKANAISAKKRALKRRDDAELILPSAVFERDGWLCGICRCKVNSTLRYPNPLSASVDHIMPLSRGGEHSYRNVQCSHLVCNLRKQSGGSH